MKTLKSTIKLIVFALASLLYACSEPEVEPVVPVAEEKPSGPPKTEVKISVKEEDFEIVVDEMISKGYVPSYIDGFIHLQGTKEQTLFNIIFREDEKTGEYKYFHGLNESGLEATIDLVEGTHNLIFLESYPQDDKILFAAIFRTGAPTQFHTELKIPYNQWQGTFDQMLEFGYRMACRSTVREGNDWYVSALFDKTPVGGWISATSLSPAAMMQKIEDQYEKGRSVSHFDVLQETTAKITFGAIFDSTTDTPVKKEIDMTSVNLLVYIESAISSGYVLQTLSAYDVPVFHGDTGSMEVRYVATWKSLRGM
jgi:hypothetical protein